MSARNLQLSEAMIAAILHRLMLTGLQPSTLAFAGLGLAPEAEPFFATCVDWLRREGIVAARDFDEARGQGATLIDPVITARGFALLGQSFGPDAGGKLHRAVSAVADADHAVPGHGIAEIGDFIGGILGGFTKTMGD